MGRRGKKTIPASSLLGRQKMAERMEEMRSSGEVPKERTIDGNRATVVVRPTPVAYGIPFDEVEFSKWTRHLLRGNLPMPWDDLLTVGSTYLPEARNMIHAEFVNNSKCLYLFMLDSDVIAPPGIIDALLNHMKRRKDVRIVGGWYKIKDEPYNPVVYHDDGLDDRGIAMYRQYGQNEVGKGLTKVDAAGAGCWLMHRRVAEAIGEEPYDMAEGGEDLLLCRKVRDAGFSLWIDWKLACAHAGVAVA